MKLSRFWIIAIVCLIPAAVSAQSVLGNPYNYGYQGSVISGEGIPNGIGIPMSTGTASDSGTVPTLTISKFSPIPLVQHLLIDQNGSGTNCSAGVISPTPWSLDANTPIDTKDKLIGIIQTAEADDMRLREVHVLDDQIDMYYLQPAYIWGFIPSNYTLHITANGTTLQVSLDKPKWIGSAKNYYSQITAAFASSVPQIFTPEAVSQIQQDDLTDRDAVMIEIVSSVMYQVHVEPISNSFFVCYIAPFLLYIILVLLLGLIFGWFIVRRLRKESGFMIQKVRTFEDRLELEKENKDEHEHTGDEHVTHFKIPKK